MTDPTNQPNLAGVIKPDDIYKKGNGKSNFTASYVPWARIAHLMHEHAPGWSFHLRASAGHDMVHKAPNGTGYIVCYFSGPEGAETSDFPYACMNHLNEAIPYERISARTLTDSHRRGFCAAAAYHFGLGYEIWAKQEVESVDSAAVAVSAKPPTQALPLVQVASQAIDRIQTLDEIGPYSKRIKFRLSTGEISRAEHDQLLKRLLSQQAKIEDKVL